MRGFESRYADLPDYILQITADIWEGRNLRALDHCYAPDLPVRMPAGLSRGSRATIDGTLATARWRRSPSFPTAGFSART